MNTNQNQPSADTGIRTVFFNIVVFTAIIVFFGVFAYSIGSTMHEQTKLMLGTIALVMLFVLPILIFAIGLIVRSTRNQIAQELAQAKQTNIRVIEPDYDEPRPTPATRRALPRPPVPLPPAYDEHFEQYQPIAPRYAPAAQYRPQQPREVFLPRVSNMGHSVPYGYEPPPPPALAEVATLDSEGQRIAIDERILSRFLSCKTPSRSEWSGARDGYTKASALCVEQGLCIRQTNGGLLWVSAFADEQTRLDWAKAILQ